MKDLFLKLFGWLPPVLHRISTGDLPLDPKERAVLKEFLNEWGKADTAALLRSLAEEYGAMAGKTIEKVLARYIREDWAAIGAREAHPGTEIADFIRILWEPLKSEGFEFTYEMMEDSVTFRVTRCPVEELARSTGLHQWLYHLACATDVYSAGAFSPKIEFKRTRTLMEGCECCNHRYSLKGC